MRTKTTFLTVLLSGTLSMLCAQAPPPCETMRIHDVNVNAKLQLQGKDGPAITEIQVNGDGVSFHGCYPVNTWCEKYSKTLDVAAGDYIVRFKQGNKWKTVHMYVQKHKQETLILN
jgi:hypothetical protein